MSKLLLWTANNFQYVFCTFQVTHSPSAPAASSSTSKDYLTIHNTRQATLILRSTTETVEDEIDFEAPEDAVINIKPKAMKRLRELREKEAKESLVLRMGVRNGGCSGLSYVMDFSTEDDIEEDDAVDLDE